MVNEIPLESLGLIDVKGACARRGWAPKSVQNWINAGLIPVAVAAGGMRRTFLLRITDVDAFTPPPRGRPKVSKPQPAPKPARKPRRKPQA